MKNLFILSEEEKNRILNLHESATKRHYLNEQEIKQGPEGDPYQYKKVGNEYFYAEKNGGEWIKIKNSNGVNAVKTKIFKENISKLVTTTPTTKKIQPTKQYCEPFPKSKDVDSSLIPQYQNEAGNLINLGIPSRTACEISFIKIRPKFRGKAFFVVDTLQNLIYLFDKNGKFVAKSQTLDGNDAQSQNAKKIAQALWTWQQQVESLGFKFDPIKKKYVDKTKQNREYKHDLVYDDVDKNVRRFFPKGIYSIHHLKTDKDYVGGNENMLSLQTLDGKQIAQAIHGFYNEPARVIALTELRKNMGTSVNSPRVPEEYINLVTKYNNTSKFNQSYGCINVPVDFLKKAKPYSTQGTFVFVVGETDKNYLVQNDAEFFDKLGTGQQCINPASLGVEMPTINGVA